MIPYGKQDINQADIDAVIEVLQSDYLTQGPKVPEFESRIAQYCNVEFAYAVNSATSALHIACLAFGLGKGDLLWTTPNTFVASANCALYCGAEVDFVDIDAKTYNISVDALQQKLRLAEKVNSLPKVVVVVHFSGQSCEMLQIKQLSDKYGFYVIEDASHAIGGRYQGAPIGNCRYSDISIFSFHPVKVITTAEGGVAVTNNPDLASKMKLFRSHGITRDTELMTSEPDGPWDYQQIALGYNYRMTELQAVLGISQMNRLDQFVKARHKLAERYDQLFKKLPIIVPWQHPDSYSGLHLYVIRLQLDQLNVSHLQVFESLREQGIIVNLHYIPVHTQPYYRALGFKRGDFPNAEQHYAEAISLPMYSLLTSEQQDTVYNALVRALKL